MAMVFTDATEKENPIIFANDSFLSLTGYDRKELWSDAGRRWVDQRTRHLALRQPFCRDHAKGRALLRPGAT